MENEKKRLERRIEELHRAMAMISGDSDPLVLEYPKLLIDAQIRKFARRLRAIERSERFLTQLTRKEGGN